MSFPLLRLPLLASINVIKNIDVGDFVPLIRTSTRMRNLIKYSRVPIELNVYGDNSIVFKKLSDPSETKQVQIFVRNLSVEHQGNVPFKPFVRQRPSWETDLEGYQRMMDDFVDIFRVKSFNVYIRRFLPDMSIQYLEYAMRLGLKFMKAQVSIDGANVEDSQKVLSACVQASKVYVTSYGCPEFFSFEGFHEYEMDYFDLDLDGRFDWFTLDHLCALVNCSSVKIVNMKLSDEGLNMFLKHWIAGAGRMETLIVHLYRPDDHVPINPQTVLDGIPRKEIERDESFEIERSGGVKARVRCQRRSFSLKVVKFTD
ncbi:unnamed protein product [Caenorhabditis brenneri]